MFDEFLKKVLKVLTPSSLHNLIFRRGLPDGEQLKICAIKRGFTKKKIS
jgi:hypothetical protein